MAEAAFIYNTTTQRPDRFILPSAHTNISILSQAQAQALTIKPIIRKSSPKAKQAQAPTPGFKEPLTPLFTPRTTNPKGHGLDPFFMSYTPLVDYKHAANQTARARTGGAQLAAQRKSSSTSGASSTARNERAPTGTARSESIASSTTESSGLTQVTSSDLPTTLPDAGLAHPFARRNGRTCLRDTTLAYPLPVDLTEIHRQTLRTMLLCQVFNGPICSPNFDTKPPKRVLEVGCGTGFWSVMCHRHFAQRGHTSTMFTGIDIAPLAPRMESDDDMKWRFVQHDLRRLPLPFRDEEFNLIMCKDLSIVIPMGTMQQTLMDEYLRILKPGGTLEIWDGDHTLRMLLSHATPATRGEEGGNENEEQVHTNAMGTYTLTPATPLAAPQNQYLQDFNVWISKAFEARKLSPMPCTAFRPYLLQESESLMEIDSRRLAIPLGEVRWEREGIGGGVKQGQNASALGSKSKAKEIPHKLLTPGQAALRRTALMTVVQMIESLEPLLREASGKGQDEWDRWQGNLMNDLLKNNGTSWGECLEVGAWWARKRKPQE